MTHSTDSQNYLPPADLEVYQGQFGEFTITPHDRQGVIVYRAGLVTMALCFAIGAGWLLGQSQSELTPTLLAGLTVLYAGFSIAFGISLWTIHIYLAPLHRALQAFWLIGTISAIGLAITQPEPLALTVYHHPITLLGVGCTFAALTGLFIKEAFCFDRLETKLLTPLIPTLLLGHLLQIMPIAWEQALLAGWAALFLVFAVRKSIQPIPPDIGDKSVFAYLKQKSAKSAEF